MKMPSNFARWTLLAAVMAASSRPVIARAETERPATFEAVAAASGAGGGESNEDLAKKTQNPVADLISVPFQNNFDFGVGPEDRTVWNLNIQPVIPFHLNERWNLVTRTILPVNHIPQLAPRLESASGIGDLNPSFFLSPAGAETFVWGLGPTMTFPTASDRQLGKGNWSMGPAAVGLFIKGPWVVGALANHQWSFAGWGKRSTNAFLLQPFLNYNFKGGWYLTSSPIITGNFSVGSGDHWVLPLGGGGGKIVRLGKVPFNISLAAYGNVVTPTDGPGWQLRFQVAALFPE